MEVSYRRAFEKSILQLKPESVSEQGYWIRMMQENRIRGLLPLTADAAGASPVFSYDISFLSSLPSVFEKRRIGSSDLGVLFSGIRDVAANCRPYLLMPQDLLLAPEYIFTDRERKEWYFCCLPEAAREEESGSGGLLLAEYLLRRIDHSDKAAVEAGYRFFSLVSSDNSSLTAAVREALQALEAPDGGEAAEGVLPRVPADGTEEVAASGAEAAVSFRENDGRRTGRNRERRTGRGTVRPGRKRRSDPVRPAAVWKTIGLLLLCVAAAAAFVLVLLLGDPDPVQVGGLSFLVVVVVAVCSRSLLAGPGPALAAADVYGEGLPAGDFRFDARPSAGYGPRQTPAEGIAAAFGMTQEGSAAPEREEETEEETYTRLLFEGGEEKTRCRMVSLGSAGDIEIEADTILVGSNRKADFVLAGTSVSRFHARIRKTGDEIFLTDLNSLNGTFVNGERLAPNRETRLEDGDRVTFADIEYQLHISGR